jgi:hypothetical protein
LTTSVAQDDAASGQSKLDRSRRAAAQETRKHRAGVPEAELRRFDSSPTTLDPEMLRRLVE